MKLQIADIQEAYVPLSTALSRLEIALKNHICNRMGFTGNVYIVQTNTPQVCEIHLDDGITHKVYRFGDFDKRSTSSTRPKEVSFKNILHNGPFAFYQYGNRGFLVSTLIPLAHPITDILEDYIKNKNKGSLSSSYIIYEISRLYDGNTRNTKDNIYSDQLQDAEFLDNLNNCMHRISSDFNISFVPV